MELDPEIKNLALEWAETIYNNIYVAMHDPTKVVSNTERKIYDDFKTWGLLSLMSFEDPKAHSFYIAVLAMDKYKRLKWAKEHPPKTKPSKWEIVTGVTKKEKK